MNDDELLAGLRSTLAEAVRRLIEAGARDEALAEFVPAHRVLLITRPAAMRPIARVWRLGVFLLDREANLYATGSITRAVEPGRSNYQSVSGEERREHRAAAVRGPFAPGETVDFGATPIALDTARLRGASGPLFLRNGRAVVRWNAAAGDDAAVDFDTYLAERVDLAAHPPEGA